MKRGTGQYVRISRLRSTLSILVIVIISAINDIKMLGRYVNPIMFESFKDNLTAPNLVYIPLVDNLCPQTTAVDSTFDSFIVQRQC